MQEQDVIEPHDELKAILESEEGQEQEVEAVAEEQPAETEAAPRSEQESTGEQQEETPVEPAQEEVPPTSQSESEDARFQAMLAKSLDERDKRQKAEADLQQLRQQMQAQQQQAEPQKAPDMFEDPEGYQAYLDKRMDDRLLMQRIEMSESLVRNQVGEEEFNSAMDAFEKSALSDPSLVVGMRNAAVPAQFAYEHGQKALLMQKIGDPADFEKRIRDEERAKVLSEMKQAQPSSQPSIADIPQSLATAGSAPPASNELPDDSLEALLGE